MERLVLIANEEVDRDFIGLDDPRAGDSNWSVNLSGTERDRPVVELETLLDDELDGIDCGFDLPGISFGGGTGGIIINFASRRFDSMGSDRKSVV